MCQAETILYEGKINCENEINVLTLNHWIGLEKDINRYRFFIFYFALEYLKKTSKFWAVSFKNESNLLLVRITHDLHKILSIDVSPAFLEHISAEKKIAVWARANRDPNKQEIGFIFAWSSSELWTLIKYSRVKIKNKKPLAVDVLFKAYPMVPLSRRTNLAPSEPLNTICKKFGGFFVLQGEDGEDDRGVLSAAVSVARGNLSPMDLMVLRTEADTR